jgi:hypothetical protein
MSSYFSNFPIISYNGTSVRDIARRTKFIETVLSNPYVFLPYTVKEGEKPEDIAFNYYGTVDATWLILIANNMIDPYTDWPMSYDRFVEFLIEKYSAQSNKTGYDVIAWLQDTTSIDNILYYYKVSDSGIELKVSPDTFPILYNEQNQAVGRDVSTEWIPMRIYDYENNRNENRREILVVEKRYYEQINEEFKELIVK